MENCLKTTLKSEVQNDNLKVLGTFTFKVKAINGDTKARLRASESVTYKFSSAVTVGGNSVTEVSGTDINTVTFPNGQEITVVVSDKYKITAISFSNGNSEITIDDVPEYLTSLRALDTRLSVFTKFDAVLERCKFGNLAIFFIRNAKLVTGNIGAFKIYTDLTILGIYSDSDADKIDVVGDISQLSTLTKLIMLYITGTNITGNVEDLLNAIAPSRENGSTLEIKTNSLVYYNGTQSARTINITFDGQGGWS